MLSARQISYLKSGSLVRLFKPDLDHYLADCLVESIHRPNGRVDMPATPGRIGEELCNP